MCSTWSVIYGQARSTADNRPTGNLRSSPPYIRMRMEFAPTWYSSSTKRQAVQRSIRRDRSIAVLRDILTMNQHVVATARTYEMAGRLLIGLDPLRWPF